MEELWDALVRRLTVAVEDALRTETDPDAFLRVKECLISFIMTLEVGYFFLRNIVCHSDRASASLVIFVRHDVSPRVYPPAVRKVRNFAGETI